MKFKYIIILSIFVGWLSCQIGNNITMRQYNIIPIKISIAEQLLKEIRLMRQIEEKELYNL